ncbi:MAG TPA: right-handed parallel beta-helix repeat-containing protein [Dermatophilaceae bacterium]|nr:right-handed parallel beta-helix repeat-containing protein [Dermatophilaceae bacterium]
MRRRPFTACAAASIAVLLILLAPGAASAHRERPAQFPSGTGAVPLYRTTGPYLLVCTDDTPLRIARLPKELRKANQALYAECVRGGYRHVQAAVDAVQVSGTRILIQPGVYREEPSLEPLSPECAALGTASTLTYDEQVTCPHAHNLIAIFGDGPDADIDCDGRLCNLQIEGTGAVPEDVVIDGGFRRHIVIRADRADGVYLRNLTVQHAPDYGVYILESDGFVIDRLVGRWNDRYAFLTFAADHGLYTDCDAYGNGDSGIYPGAASPQLGARHAIEITRCRSHHNMAGLGGTAGSSLWVHDNDFFDNTAGIALDSLFPNHPGMPQGHSRFTGNRIYSNNQDFFQYWRDGTCSRPSEERGYEAGVVCPTAPMPIGTGILLAGGNANEFSGNWIWDNWRFGAVQLWAPAPLRGETDPTRYFDTSHFNRYVANHLGASPSGELAPNGVDFLWDEEGTGNCWQDNLAPEGRAQTSDPESLPGCGESAVFSPPNPAKTSWMACLAWSPSNLDPPGCVWTSAPSAPG